MIKTLLFLVALVALSYQQSWEPVHLEESPKPLTPAKRLIQNHKGTADRLLRPLIYADHLRFESIEENISIIKKLGEGTFGKVYLATDKKSNRIVAAKVMQASLLRESSESATNLGEEIDIMKHLPAHPNICQFYRSFETGEEVDSGQPGGPDTRVLRSEEPAAVLEQAQQEPR